MEVTSHHSGAWRFGFSQLFHKTVSQYILDLNDDLRDPFQKVHCALVDNINVEGVDKSWCSGMIIDVIMVLTMTKKLAQICRPSKRISKLPYI